jgi:hypothetical protein
MKKRNIAAVMIYGFITLGIYDLVWLYKTRKELIARGAKIPNFALLLTPILAAAIALIALLIIGITQSNDSVVDTSQTTTSVISIMVMLAAVLATLASIPIVFYWLYKYSEAVEHVTRGQTTTGFSFGMALVFYFVGVSFVWNGLIQDAFNKLEEPAVPTTPSPQSDQPQQPPAAPPTAA